MSTSNATVLSSFSAPSDLLSPTAVYQTAVSTYASVGALAVLIWDILENAASDYRILSTKRFNISMVAYIGSRIGTLGYMLGGAIFSTAPTGNCVAFDKINTAFCPIAISCSAFLFFLRLRAIYDRNRIVVATFAIFLLGLFAGTLFVPLGVTGGAITGTQYCQDVSVAKSVNAGQIAPLAYDTLVFFAISWRLRGVASPELGFGEGFEAMTFGTNLPPFTRALLQDGQVYYLLTLLAGIPAAVLIYAPSVPFPLRSLANDPYIVIVNIMACRVYRRTKLGLIRESQLSTTGMTPTRTTQAVVYINTTTGHDSSISRTASNPSESMGNSKVEMC